MVFAHPKKTQCQIHAELWPLIASFFTKKPFFQIQRIVFPSSFYERSYWTFVDNEPKKIFQRYFENASKLKSSLLVFKYSEAIWSYLNVLVRYINIQAHVMIGDSNSLEPVSEPTTNWDHKHDISKVSE